MSTSAYHVVLDAVVFACSDSTQEAEAGGLQVPGQPGQRSEMLSQKPTSCCTLQIDAKELSTQSAFSIIHNNEDMESAYASTDD
jgi:hypothetical protein